MSGVYIDTEEDPGHLRVVPLSVSSDKGGEPIIASLWVGNENAAQEADVMMTRSEVLLLIKALKGVLY